MSTAEKSECDKDVEAAEAIKQYYNETMEARQRGVLKRKSINKFCEELEITTGGGNIRKRFTTLWKKGNLEQHWNDGVSFEDASVTLFEVIQQRRKNKKNVMDMNFLVSIADCPVKVRDKKYVVRERTLRLKPLSRVSPNEVKSLQEAFPSNNGPAVSSDIIELSCCVYQLMVDSWSSTPAHSRPPKPTPVTIAEKIATWFFDVVESVTVETSAEGNSTELDASEEMSAEETQAQAVRNIVESTPVNRYLRVRLLRTPSSSGNRAHEDERDDDGSDPLPISSCIRISEDCWSLFLPLLPNDSNEGNDGVVTLNTADLLDSSKCQVIIPTQRDYDMRIDRSNQSDYRAHRVKEELILAKAKDIGREQWHEYVYSEFQALRVEGRERPISREDFFESRFIASIVNPFHTMVHVKTLDVSIDVHVCIQGRSIAAVTAPVFDATWKELMGDREETSEATEMQYKFKKGETVTLKRDSSGVDAPRQVPPRQSSSTEETGARRTSPEESMRRAKFLYTTLNLWKKHKEKVSKSRKRPSTPRNYWQLDSMNQTSRKAVIKMFLGDSTGKLSLKKEPMEQFIRDNVDLSKDSVDAKELELRQELDRLGGHHGPGDTFPPEEETRDDVVQRNNNNTASSAVDLALETVTTDLSNISMEERG